MTARGPGQLFLDAAGHHQAGRLAEAEALYRQVLALDPVHADSLHNLGVLAHQVGRNDVAAELIGRAAAVNGKAPAVHSNLATALNALGRWGEAAAAARRAVELAPSYAQAHNTLGVALQGLGRPDEAAAAYRRSIALRPDGAEAHCNLGNALAEAGRPEEAVAAYRRALELRPDYPEAHNNLGALLLEQGRAEEAEAACRRAVALRPDYADALNNLAAALWRRRDFDEAADLVRRALAARPGFAEAENTLGNIAKDLGDLDAAEAAYRRAVGLKPDYAEAYGNLGVLLWRRGRIEAAAAACRAALAAEPGHPSASTTLAAIEAVSGRIEAAEALCRQALAARPDYGPAHSALLFTLNYAPDKDGDAIFQAYRDYDRAMASRFGAAAAPPARPLAGRKLRIGYLSPDFRRHPCRHFLQPLFDLHDREQVSLHAYAEIVSEDDVTAWFRARADAFIPTNGLDDEALAARIRADGIDVLVDLAGHTDSNRLEVMARRPAPVSATWIGTGYTTGLKAIDYILADRIMAPAGSEELFGETPWPLRTTYIFRPSEGMGEPGPLPALSRGGVSFATLTRAIRINHRTIRAWAAILKRVEGSRLVVDSRDFQHGAMRSSLLERFAAEGIGPERLEIGFHSPPWDLLRRVDITLDCFPHNSGTTLFESVYMGVPVVSLAGRPSLGRIGASILTAVGHAEWIASSEEEYVEIAARLASDLPALAEVRRHLRAEMQASPLMDEEGFVRGLEAAYRQMIERAVSAN